MFYSSGRAPDDSVSLASSVPDEEDEYYRRVAGALLGALARGDATGALNPRRALRALHAALDLTGEDSRGGDDVEKNGGRKNVARVGVPSSAANSALAAAADAARRGGTIDDVRAIRDACERCERSGVGVDAGTWGSVSDAAATRGGLGDAFDALERWKRGGGSPDAGRVAGLLEWALEEGDEEKRAWLEEELESTGKGAYLIRLNAGPGC